MKRLDLVTLRQQSQQRLRLVLGTLVFVAIWMTALFSYSNVILDRLGLRGFLIAAGLPIVALLIAAFNSIFGAPKCPHCGTRLVGSLLHTAIGSGNCGYCGRRLED
ncbi:MAG: hypothetical protein WAM82_25765 [Thermoanaerobaculia bacterium]